MRREIALQLLVDPVKTMRAVRYHYRAVAYDRRHGIETGKRDIHGLYEATEGNDEVPYDPTEPKYLRWALRNLPIDPRQYVFVDFGSGKGRVLIAAAQQPFLRVMGVEYSRELHDDAVRNIRSAKGMKCQDVTSLCMDAGEFSIPDAPCVLFFYNPFGRGTMERVLSRVRTSLLACPRPLFLVYVNPVLHGLFLQQPGLKLVRGRDWCNLYTWSA